MKTLPAIIIFGFFLVSCSDKEDLNLTALPENNELKDLLVKTISDKDIPGMIVAIVDGDGIRTIESAGLRKIASSDSLTVDDQIHLGSCTKAMTSTLLATLVNDGQITWETTLIQVFPELGDIIHEDFHNITLHQLVTHRAGVPPNAKDWWLSEDLEIKERRVAIMKDNLNEPSQLTPGQFSYSNLGYMIAGSMAEKVTGFTWESLMKERLFDPLGMSSAGFGAPGTLNQTDQPWGHYKSEAGWETVQADNPEALGPAGRVHSTFRDWAKFISLELPQKDPAILDRDQLNFLIDPTGDYAAGWFVVQRPWAQGVALSHNGSNTLWYVVVWVAPELNRAYMVGTNSYDENTFTVCDGIIGKLIEFDQSL